MKFTISIDYETIYRTIDEYELEDLYPKGIPEDLDVETLIKKLKENYECVYDMQSAGWLDYPGADVYINNEELFSEI